MSLLSTPQFSPHPQSAARAAALPLTSGAQSNVAATAIAHPTQTAPHAPHEHGAGIGLVPHRACCSRLRCAVRRGGLCCWHSLPCFCPTPPRRGHFVLSECPSISHILPPPRLCIFRVHSMSTLCWGLHNLTFAPKVTTDIQIPLPMWVNKYPTLPCAGHWSRHSIGRPETANSTPASPRNRRCFCGAPDIRKEDGCDGRWSAVRISGLCNQPALPPAAFPAFVSVDGWATPCRHLAAALSP